MPALQDTELQALRARLDAREAELRAALRSSDEEAHPPSGTPHDRVEDAGEQGEQRIREAVRRAERERDAGELREITSARERMQQGRYGQCIDCGTDIALARLQARPSSLRCLACQERFERSHPAEVRM